MKHLKTYNEIFSFTSEHDLKLNMIDILQDLEDEGFSIDVQVYTDCASVYINKVLNWDDEMKSPTSTSKFKYSDIKPYVEHLKSFMKSNKWELKSVHTIHNYKPFVMQSDDDVMGRIELRFYLNQFSNPKIK